MLYLEILLCALITVDGNDPNYIFEKGTRADIISYISGCIFAVFLVPLPLILLIMLLV
jgi:hypothetical protein